MTDDEVEKNLIPTKLVFDAMNYHIEKVLEKTKNTYDGKRYWLCENKTGLMIDKLITFKNTWGKEYNYTGTL